MDKQDEQDQAIKQYIPCIHVKIRTLPPWQGCVGVQAGGMALIPRVLLFFLILAGSLSGQTSLSAVARAEGNHAGSIEQPLRYRPEGGDFVINGGREFFNRPLYGGNSAFRVDAGDQPEFSLYMPGHGGNLRLGFRTPAGAKWLSEASDLATRYRPGMMVYEIRDPLLGLQGLLKLQVLALFQTEGLLIRVEAEGLDGTVELLAAYGGLSGKRGVRDGDIGTEAVPISQYFQLQPESCRDNVFVLSNTTDGACFGVSSKGFELAGVFPPGTRLALGDAAHWGSPGVLFETAGGLEEQGGALSKGPVLPVLLARYPLPSGRDGGPLYLLVQRVSRTGGVPVSEDLGTYRAVTTERAGSSGPAVLLHLAAPYGYSALGSLFEQADAHFAALRRQVQVETPDPYINAAAASLNVAADAVWDETQGALMHGAIAWRTKLLGWRGPYALDALGWHERARRNFDLWLVRQNTDPIPDKLPPADEKSNLARNEEGLHSNGDLSNSHYDMNTVFIDALFRHLAWTGDLDWARAQWPVLERHLAWERRLFRREFGPERLPLYEAYAVIWASDDLYYGGGGATHATAYQYFHNTQAARLARLLGADPSPYEHEASLLARSLRELLWMPGAGTFAESKDYLGLQRVHPSAGLWTFYHVMDAGLVTPGEAGEMVTSLETRRRALPVRGPGVPSDAPYHVFSTTDWMPYSWSINNVVMGENLHTALGCWQAGRPEEAFHLAKGALLASMFMGISPGNVGTMNRFDVYRREAQRDFADGAGVASRALVEGLFGVRPDVLAGELLLVPGFPDAWPRASLQHPDVSLRFSREGRVDTYVIGQSFSKPLALRLQVRSRGGEPRVLVNGNPVAALPLSGGGDALRFEIRAAPARQHEVSVRWAEGLQAPVPTRVADAAGVPERVQGLSPVDWTRPCPGRFDCLELSPWFNDQVTRLFAHEYRSPRSPFVSLSLPKQGIGAWAGHVKATAELDDSGLRAVAAANGGRLLLPNGVPLATPSREGLANCLFTSRWDQYPVEATLPLSGRAGQVYLLMAGSTNWMQSRLDNGEVLVTYADGTSTRLALRNPETWWPIEQDYLVDDFQFPLEGALPLRVDLKTGKLRQPERTSSGGLVPGGAATVLQLTLDPERELQSLTVRTLSNDVIIGLLSATLVRNSDR